MPHLTATQILSIAESTRETPRSTGREVDAVAAAMCVTFPPTFRRLMVQTGGGFERDETRFLSLHEIAAATREAADVVANESNFTLSKTDVVFRWDSIYAFSYFSATGEDNAPIFEFNYNCATGPVLTAKTVPQGLALSLKYILRID